MGINNYPFFFRKKVINCYLNCFAKNKANYVIELFNISNGTLFNWLKLYKNNNLKSKVFKTKFSKQIVLYICNYV